MDVRGQCYSRNGIQMDFPFLAYSEYEIYMDAVVRAKSITGIVMDACVRMYSRNGILMDECFPTYSGKGRLFVTGAGACAYMERRMYRAALKLEQIDENVVHEGVGNEYAGGYDDRQGKPGQKRSFELRF